MEWEATGLLQRETWDIYHPVLTNGNYLVLDSKKQNIFVKGNNNKTIIEFEHWLDIVAIKDLLLILVGMKIVLWVYF